MKDVNIISHFCFMMLVMHRAIFSQLSPLDNMLSIMLYDFSSLHVMLYILGGERRYVLGHPQQSTFGIKRANLSYFK